MLRFGGVQLVSRLKPLTDIFCSYAISRSSTRSVSEGLVTRDVVEIGVDDRDNRDLGPRVRPRLSHMKPRYSGFLLNRQRT